MDPGVLRECSGHWLGPGSDSAQQRSVSGHLEARLTVGIFALGVDIRGARFRIVLWQ